MVTSVNEQIELSKEYLIKVGLPYPTNSIKIRDTKTTFIPDIDYTHEKWVSLEYKGDTLLISDCGRVKRSTFKKLPYLLKQNASTGRFTVSVGSKRRSVNVHILVALAFLGIKEDGYEVDHINGNRYDNHSVNLEYVTHEENVRRAVSKGLLPEGSFTR